MANLRTAMDSAFWDQPISSPQTLYGSANFVPGDPFPLDAARASRALRIQQLALMGLDWFRPKKLSLSRDAAKQYFLDKSLYSIALCSQLSPVPSSSFLWNMELHGQKNAHRLKLMLYQQKNRGLPQSVNAVNGEAPAALMPGLCARAAFSYEQSKDIWRQKETKKDLIATTDMAQFWRPAYDVCLKEPCATISAIIGGTFAVWFGGSESSQTVESQDMDMKKRSPLNADLFGSVCCTFQDGWFRKPFGDLTRFDARLDICSASGLAKRALNIIKSSSTSDAEKSLSLSTTGPVVFRVDSKFLLDSSSEKQGQHMEDIIYSLSYSLRLLCSGKVVAWYSPKRKEGMIELQLYEF
ncbi:hypothetical protein QYF36_012405 [Acer negundo]|nr:hypothetical protein QYF36_012405 [Acer negundo]